VAGGACLTHYTKDHDTALQNERRRVSAGEPVEESSRRPRRLFRTEGISRPVVIPAHTRQFNGMSGLLDTAALQFPPVPNLEGTARWRRVGDHDATPTTPSGTVNRNVAPLSPLLEAAIVPSWAVAIL
jgi:hypothetical protein